MAYVRYSRDYVPAEATAKSERRGIWAGEFMPPWQWPNSASGREESENRIDLLSLAFGVVILGIIGLAILNADNSGSPV